MWNYVVLAIFLFILLVMWVRRVERFISPHNVELQYTNSGPEIHQRAPVNISIPENTEFKHKKAYNYEMENKEYANALRETFEVDTNSMCTQAIKWHTTKQVTKDEPVSNRIDEMYRYAVDYIQNKLIESPHFQLPDMQLSSIQVVHDVLLAYQNHKYLPSSILTIQLILYRESKYHGKDVGMVLRVDKEKGRYIVTVVDIWINGVVFEDKIALFPVVGTPA